MSEGSTYYTGGYSTVTASPDVYFVIKCYGRKPIGEKGIIYDAEQIRANLREKYKVGDKKSNSLKKHDASPKELIDTSQPKKESPAQDHTEDQMSEEDKMRTSRAFDSVLS